MCSVLGEDGGTCIFVGCVIQEKYRAETLRAWRAGFSGWMILLFGVNVGVCVF